MNGNEDDLLAAAAYGLWRIQQDNEQSLPADATLLVCYVTTTAFRLALVSSTDDSLQVVDTLEDNSGGELADRLIGAWIVRQFNARYAIPFSEAVECLNDSNEQATAWLRQARGLKERLSVRAGYARSGRVLAVTETLTDRAGRSLAVSFDLAALRDCLRPWYDHHGQLLRDLLERHRDRLPVGLVIAGGASRTPGWREAVLEPALAPHYPRDLLKDLLAVACSEPRQPHQVVTRGAALIADGKVRVRRSLPYTIGLVVEVPAGLGPQLGIPGHDYVHDYLPVVLSPVLEWGTALPAETDSDSLGLPTVAIPYEPVEFTLVIQSDPTNFWIQCWRLDPGDADACRTLGWRLQVAADHSLTLTWLTAQGEPAVLTGRLERTQGGTAPDASNTNLPRITPQTLREAILRADADTP